VEVEDGWYWRNGMVSNMLEIGSAYFGTLVLDNAGGKIGSVAGCAEPIAWCGLLHWVAIAVNIEWCLGSFSIWCRCR
jgi:hypothetical protein